jgi:predicted DCC family thiol-disulfide oxidoreductase YuxK
MTVILYDGECGFCAASIRFVWRRDRAGAFHFAAIQSEPGRKLLAQLGIEDPKLETLYLLEGNEIFERSNAGLRIVRRLPRYRLMGTLGQLVPRFLRDWVYDWVARNRHRLRQEPTCERPPEEVRQRFLDQQD